MIVRCDNCGSVFGMDVKRKTKVFKSESVQMSYLKCPHCRKKYLVCYDNHHTNRLRNKLQKLYGQRKTDEIFEKIKKTQSELTKEMERLKREYEEMF